MPIASNQYHEMFTSNKKQRRLKSFLKINVQSHNGSQQQLPPGIYKVTSQHQPKPQMFLFIWKALCCICVCVCGGGGGDGGVGVGVGGGGGRWWAGTKLTSIYAMPERLVNSECNGIGPAADYAIYILTVILSCISPPVSSVHNQKWWWFSSSIYLRKRIFNASLGNHEPMYEHSQEIRPMSNLVLWIQAIYMDSSQKILTTCHNETWFIRIIMVHIGGKRSHINLRIWEMKARHQTIAIKSDQDLFPKKIETVINNAIRPIHLHPLWCLFFAKESVFEMLTGCNL